MPLASEVALAELFERSANASAVFDTDLRFVGANQAFLALTQLEWTSIHGRMLSEVLAPADAAPIEASLRSVLATGTREDLPFIRYVGERVVSASTSCMRDRDGRVAWLLHQVADVTNLRPETVNQLGLGILGRASRAADQQRLLQQVFEQSPGFAAVLQGPDHRFVLANPSYLEMIGRDASVIGKTVVEAVPEVVEQGFVHLLDKVYATGEPFVGRGVEIQLVRNGQREQRILDFVYQPIRFEGQTVAIFALGQDITDVRRIDRERIRLQSAYRELIELAPQQVWTAQPTGKLDSVNQHGADYFGVPAESLLGDAWTRFVHPDDREITLRTWASALATSTPYQRDFRLLRADGEYRWHLARATPVRTPDGKLLAWIGTNTDIHDARSAHDELITRASYEEKLIGIVSHDLRNPLAAITLALPLLDDSNLTESGKRAYAHIKAAAARSERLISDLMDFAQARNGSFPIHPGPTNLPGLIRSAVEVASLFDGAREVAIHHEGPAIGSWDEGRLIQLFANLIGNAFQHAPKGAAIGVSSRIEGGVTTIAVFNAGSAISDVDQERLFDPFARGKNARTKRGRSIGLGLYIAQQIALAHGGSIAVDSSPDRGTTFTVTLPTRPAV